MTNIKTIVESYYKLKNKNDFYRDIHSRQRDANCFKASYSTARIFKTIGHVKNHFHFLFEEKDDYIWEDSLGREQYIKDVTIVQTILYDNYTWEIKNFKL